jgi:hypothetical protein
LGIPARKFTAVSRDHLLSCTQRSSRDDIVIKAKPLAHSAYAPAGKGK